MAGPVYDYVMKVYTTERDAIKGDKEILLTAGESINTTTNIITAAEPHDLEVGDIVYFDGTLVGNAGLRGTKYHVKTVDSTTTFTISVAKSGHEFSFTDATVTAGFVIRSNALPVESGGNFNNLISNGSLWSSSASGSLLNGAVTRLATTITVDDGTDFAVGDVIRVNQEEMSVSGISTHVLTVTRGVNDTIRNAHVDNSGVFDVTSTVQKPSHIIDPQDTSTNKILTSGYWTNVKYYYRIESNEPAKKFYIDWDDGEDNDPASKANYSAKEFETPQDYAVFPHIYTKHGAFFPKIKITSIEGFESKYYTPSWGATAATPYANKQVITITTAADSSDSLDDVWFRIYDGKNQGYHVWLNTDSTSDQRHTLTIPPELKEVEITAVTGSNLGTGIATGDSSSTVATVLGNALGTNVSTCLHEVVGAWTKGVSSNVVTLTNVQAGKCNYPDAGNSNFDFAVTIYGAENDVSSLEKDPQSALGTGRIIQSDSVTSHRLPVLAPANVPPVAVLKLDKTQVYAGIDNTPLEDIAGCNVMCYLDGKDFHGESAATINGKLRRAAEATLDNILEVVWVDTLNRTHKDTVGVNTQASTSDSYNIGLSTVFVKKVLSVKIKDLREGGPSSTGNLYPNEKIHLIGFQQTSGGTCDLPTSASIADGTDATICSVSLGNPYASASEPSSQVTLDGSESYTRNSNVTIDKYVFDTGRHTEGLNGIIATGAQYANASYSMFRGAVNPYLPERLPPSTKTSFCFDIGKGEQLDGNHRFYDKEQLIRLQLEDSSINTRVRDSDSVIFSTLEVDNSSADNYIADGRSLFWPPFAKPQGVMLYYGVGSGSAAWTNVANLNVNNQSEIFGGAASAAKSLLNADGDAAVDDAENFLLVVKDKKFNKIHFNVDNDIPPDHIRKGTDTNACALTVWYSTRNGWTPIEFTDTTEVEKNGSEPFSLVTNGSVTFDMPVDWEKLSSEDVQPGDSTAAPIDHDIAGTSDPVDLWDFNGYGILVGFSVTGSPTAIRVMRAHVTNNTHSQLLTIKDPMYVSLSEIPVAQSISYGRAGTFHRI